MESPSAARVAGSLLSPGTYVTVARTGDNLTLVGTVVDYDSVALALRVSGWHSWPRPIPVNPPEVRIIPWRTIDDVYVKEPDLA